MAPVKEKSASSSEKLKDLIEKAIEDQELTISEYERIFRLASMDDLIDRQEKSLLKSLLEMIESGAVRRVPDRK